MNLRACRHGMGSISENLVGRLSAPVNSAPEFRIDRRNLPGLLSDTLMPGSIVNPAGILSRRMALAVALALAACAPALQAETQRAQRHEKRHEIEQIEDAWRDAILKSNVSAMEALLGDDYIAITASGTLETKEKALANLRAGLVHFNSIAFSERKLRFYGTTALVTSRAEVRGMISNRDISGSYRYTRVYARDGQGKWKIVSFEASRIRDGDEKR
jgi:ketosteroid isomerase-like protein